MAWNVFDELRSERNICDVLIRVDGEEFAAHKIILYGSYQSLPRAILQENVNGKVYICGVSVHYSPQTEQRTLVAGVIVLESSHMTNMFTRSVDMMVLIS